MVQKLGRGFETGKIGLGVTGGRKGKKRCQDRMALCTDLQVARQLRAIVNAYADISSSYILI